MENKNSNLDDLIGTSNSEPVIIRQDGGDKKFLYTLLIILVILFVIAVGVIAFLGGKYFSSNSNQPANGVVAKQSMQTGTVASNGVNQHSNSAAMASNDTTLRELEAIVNSENNSASANTQAQKSQTKEQKAIAKVASAVSGGGALSQDDLAKIAKLVAMELAKSKAVSATQNSASATKSANKDSDLVAQLEGAKTDTLSDQKVNSSGLKDAKSSKSAKKVDTFNKVVVKQNSSGDDELAKLSSEIDAILQTEEVKKAKSSYKYKKVIEQNAKERANESRFIVVKDGDTLGLLALRAYGRASAYTKIYEANPELVKNPNRIYVGMKLRVPVDEEYLKQQQGR